jgi:hypothetical protein
MDGEADQTIEANVSSASLQDANTSIALDNGGNKDRILRRGDLARIIGL